MDGGFWGYVKATWTWLPTVMGMIGTTVGAILSIVQLYESRTFQHWKNNWLTRYRARKLARLQRKAALTAARIHALERIKTARTEARVIVEEATVQASKITEKTALESINGEMPSSG